MKFIYKYLVKNRTLGKFEWIYINESEDNLGIKLSHYEAVKTYSPLLISTGLTSETKQTIYKGDIVNGGSDRNYVVTWYAPAGSWSLYLDGKLYNLFNQFLAEKSIVVGNEYIPSGGEMV